MTGQATERKALIFDIQSFSIQDGPGIRTTVFFKGCPLNCIWCHNPESKTIKPQLMFYKSRCTGCMLCAENCRDGAQIALSDGSHYVLNEKCTFCGKCLEFCCYDALKICGAPFSPEELCERLKSDMRYFNLEGKTGGGRGGITFSGGEPLLYSGFIRDFCALVPDVHTAMETSGYGSREDLEKITGCIDLFLFDIKLINGSEHKKYCGAGNDVILDNLKFLYENDKDIILRLPLIPGINDTAEQLDGIVKLLEKYPRIKRVEIMPYHNLGLGKLEALGMEIPAELPRLNAGREKAEKWLGEFRARGFDRVYCA
ncbi:MAG: glycyl-radical enzyme activating protein [Treponema sp.]|nr:glycyl-radical enzyme activating protein [Treponema sp.]